MQDIAKGIPKYDKANEWHTLSTKRSIKHMFNEKKLLSILSAYKQHFPKHWEDEKYKWEAVQHFQNYWN